MLVCRCTALFTPCKPVNNHAPGGYARRRQPVRRYNVPCSSSSGKREYAMCSTHTSLRHYWVVRRTCATQPPADEDSVESLFQKELERRKSREALGPSVRPPRLRQPPSEPMEPPRRTEYDIPPQLQKSRDLNSEGLSVRSKARGHGIVGRTRMIVQHFYA